MVRIEFNFQKIIEFLIIVRLDNLLSCRFLSFVDDKVNGIFIASECIANLAGLL